MQWIILGVVALLLFAGDEVSTLLNSITRGARLTHAPADENGRVNVEPDELADQAGLSQEVYSAARMLSSEEGRSSNATKAAICHCLMNEARRRGISVTALLTRARNARNNGYYGSQKDKDPDSDNFGKSDRYASTALDPYQGEADIAQACFDGTISDFTGGATQYDRPSGESDPDRVAANRINAGSELVAVQGVDDGIRFWRPA